MIIEDYMVKVKIKEVNCQEPTGIKTVKEGNKRK